MSPPTLRTVFRIAAAAILGAFGAKTPAAAPAADRPPPVTDTIPTAAGPLAITFLGHGTLMFEFGGKVVHVDPWTRAADYKALPQADLILITHEHGDHLDPAAIARARHDTTRIVASPAAAEQIAGAEGLKNGAGMTVLGLQVEVVPAYNLVHLREDGTPYHPKGRGNGYVVTFGDKRVYVAGDSENTPEMKALQDIAIAFLPMNLPYTMTAEMVADAARAFRPEILYPYHYGETDPRELVERLEGSGIEVRVRDLK